MPVSCPILTWRYHLLLKSSTFFHNFNSFFWGIMCITAYSDFFIVGQYSATYTASSFHRSAEVDVKTNWNNPITRPSSSFLKWTKNFWQDDLDYKEKKLDRKLIDDGGLLVYVLLPPLKMERPKKLKDEKEGRESFWGEFQIRERWESFDFRRFEVGRSTVVELTPNEPEVEDSNTDYWLLFFLRVVILSLLIFRHYWTKLTPAISERTFWASRGSKGAAPPC